MIVMLDNGTLAVKPGNKFKHKRKNTIYIVRSVSQVHENKTVVLVSENSEAGMRIQMDELLGGQFEPVYD